MVKIKDLTGKKFNNWTVLVFDSIKGTKYMWKCVCTCGVIKNVSSGSLKNESSKSCGCGGLEKSLIGQRFGRLVVVERVNMHNKNNKSWKYKCECDCGNTLTVFRCNLLKGDTQSCGCFRNEVRDKDYFEGTKITHIRSKTVWVTNTSGVRGVSWNAGRQKWEAHITFRYKKYSLGLHENISDAAAIRKRAEEKIFGEFLEWYDSKFPKKSKTVNANA